MKVLGLEIKRAEKQQLTPAPRRNIWNVISEPFAGAWQRNKFEKMGDIMSSSAVYACTTRIASDIAKLPFRLVRNDYGIGVEADQSPFLSVLRKPNHYQNAIQFRESWILSKLMHGNTYVLKRWDNRGVVDALYVLNPNRVVPLISESGDVYYEITFPANQDLVPASSRPAGQIRVPARALIHDRMNCFYNPLIGISPLSAALRAAQHGINIQENSKTFFENLSRPGGVLTLPAGISDEDAEKVKLAWQAGFTGINSGQVAVIGADLKYQPTYVNASDSQLLEQLKWTSETICSVFGVPAYMVGIGPQPSYNNVGALQQAYYTQCLQSLIEAMELCLDEGLALPNGLGTELDLAPLLRMDTAARYKANGEAIAGGWMTPNEVRRREDLPAVPGGDSCFLQQQNFSLEALAKRDQQADPFNPGGTDAG